MFEVVGDGTHRAHFARIFGLPLLAMIKTSTLPRSLLMIDRPELPGLRDPAVFGQWQALWRGLRAQCLFVNGQFEFGEDSTHGGLAQWTPTRMCAEWMLLPPQSATEVNRAYDRVYPGALQRATGLAESVLFDTQAWAETMLGDAAMDPVDWDGSTRTRCRARQLAGRRTCLTARRDGEGGRGWGGTFVA